MGRWRLIAIVLGLLFESNALAYNEPIPVRTDITSSTTPPCIVGEMAFDNAGALLTCATTNTWTKAVLSSFASGSIVPVSAGGTGATTVAAAKGALNIQGSSPLDYNPSGCTGSGDDSAAANSALAATKVLTIPSGHTCVFGNVAVGTGMTVDGTGSGHVAGLAGANYIFKESGTGPVIKNLIIDDNGAVTSNATVPSGATTGATTITISAVSSGPPVQAGQRAYVMTTAGYWATAMLEPGTGGTTAVLSRGLQGTVAAGAAFYSSFGDIYLTNVFAPRVENIRVNGPWLAVLADDPNALSDGVGVSEGWIKGVITAGGHLGCIAKARNATTLEITENQCWGGFTETNTFTSDGVTTNFGPLTSYTLLSRELTVKLNGVTKTIGTDYTVPDGLHVTFTSPPATGSANNIAISHYAYGAEGYLDTCDDSTSMPCGGNFVANTLSLQWNEPYRYQSSQLARVTNIVADSGSQACMEFDNATQLSSFTAVALNWCPSQVWAHNTSTGINVSGSTYIMPASYSTSGVAGVMLNVETGSTVNVGSIFSPTVQYGGNGIGYNCDPTYTLAANAWQWCGTGTGHGSMKLSADASTLGFLSQYSYIAADNVANAVMEVQATNTGGVVQLNGKANSKLKVSGADILVAGAAQVTANVPINLQSYTIASLPGCGSVVSSGSIAIATDFASVPTRGTTTLTNGGSVKWGVTCLGSSWTAN